MIHLLAAVWPEQVAVRDTQPAQFYAGGLRVRGKSVERVPGDVQQAFLLGPPVEKFTKAAHLFWGKIRYVILRRNTKYNNVILLTF